MTIKQLKPSEVTMLKNMSGQVIGKHLSTCLLDYSTRTITRTVPTGVVETVYQLGNTGLELGHRDGTFTIYDIGEGSKMLAEARASLGI